ncbi:MAG TPA: Flp family type IVb pilin [Kineosporiaceae bacterium]|nr:Flp family type IVb pilin [Kineosporiaceae bacterium]
MLNYLRKVMRDTKERGASAVEYGLMVAAIAAVIVGIVFGLGGIVREVFGTTCNEIGTSAGANTAACPAAPAAPPAGQ